MNRMILATLPIITVLALSISGCGAPRLDPTPTPSPTPARRPTQTSTVTRIPTTPTSTATRMPPTPTPEILEPNYTSAAWGFSLWYPERWVYDEQVEGVIFATSEEFIAASEFSTGAAMGVLGAELQTGQTVEEFLQTMLDELYFEEIETSESKSCTVGGQRGIMVTFVGTPEEGQARLKGFIAVARKENRGYLFMAVSAADLWSEYEFTLEQVLRSVRFEKIEHTYANDRLGLAMWYPDDWIYEEDYDQVTFATSDDVLRSADLETGAAMLVRTSPLREASLEEWFKRTVAESKFRNGGPTAKVKPRMIGGRAGQILTFEGSLTGSQIIMQGFTAATEDRDWGYFFLGASAASEWSEYGPTLHKMLDSVQFTE